MNMATPKAIVTVTSGDTLVCGEFASGSVEGTAVVERIRTGPVEGKVVAEDAVDTESMVDVDGKVDEELISG